MDKLENEIAKSTAAGREALSVWHEVMSRMPGAQKVAKAFELTETTRQIMRAGIRHANPSLTEEQIHELYVDRLLQFHGTSLTEVRQKQREQAVAKQLSQK